MAVQVVKADNTIHVGHCSGSIIVGVERVSAVTYRQPACTVKMKMKWAKEKRKWMIKKEKR